MGRALGLLVGYALDEALGDPRRLHPVAGFGQLATAVERRSYRDSRGAGVVHTVLLVGGAVALGAAGPQGTLATAACTWAVLGGRSLRREAESVHARLAAGDLVAAREQVTRAGRP